MAVVLRAAALAGAVSRETSLMFTVFRRRNSSHAVRLLYSQEEAVTEATQNLSWGPSWRACSPHAASSERYNLCAWMANHLASFPGICLQLEASVGAPPLPLLFDAGASRLQLWALAAGLGLFRVANPSAFQTGQA